MNGDRSQWRNWVDEKQKLLREHNKEKQELTSELHTLRKSLNMSEEQVGAVYATPIAE